MLTRPDIDKTRLGVTGQSGGGTLSAYLWAMDTRLKMVASSCWTTSYLLDIENGMPADNEQYPPGFIARGLDKIDFFMSRAGSAALLLGQEQDFFDDRGLKQGHRELLRIHKLLGGDPRLCRLSMDTGVHAFSEANQVAMVKFFNRALGRGNPPRDRKVDAPEEKDLKVTPHCDVNKFGSRPMYDIVADLARKTVKARKKIRPDALPGLVRKVLHVGKPAAPPHHRRLFHTGRKREGSRQHVYRFIVESEPGIQCVLRHVCRNRTPFRLQPDEEVFLFLPNACSQLALQKKTIPRGTADGWVLDVRGQGESALEAADVSSAYGHDYMHSGHALLYGESLLGDRVFDVLSTVSLLRSEGAKRIHLVGRGQGGILALIAGVLDSRISTVSSLQVPKSIQVMVSTPLNTWPTADFPRGILKHFDLPDLRKALGKRLVKHTLGDAGVFRVATEAG
jgi:hypothetical protein